MQANEVKTEWITLSGEATDQDVLHTWGKRLREGALVAFPTETVYGLGANGFDEESAAKIYQAKGRPSDNPLILHVADVAMWERAVESISPLERQLIATFCPGPLTIVMTKSNRVPLTVTGGGDTVGIRMPSHPVAMALIRSAEVPIAAPSANRSGRPSPSTASAVKADLNGRIDAIIDGGATAIGVESTVIACHDEVIEIYRPGAITPAMLAPFGQVVIPSLDEMTITRPKAPGMKYRHYAPSIPVEVFVGEHDALLAAWRDCDVSRIGFYVDDTIAHILKAPHIVAWGGEREIEAMAHHLFDALLQLEKRGVEKIYVQGTAAEGLGLAVMNRLYKSAQGKITRL